MSASANQAPNSTCSGVFPRAGVATSCSLNIALSEWGDDIEAPVVVMVHGWKDHGRMWHDAAVSLLPDHLVVAPDLRGHGNSDWSPDADYSTLALLADLNAVVDLYSRPVRLVAHSLGGEIAMRFAAVFPEKVSKLLVIEGFGLSKSGRASLLRRELHQRYRHAILARNVAHAVRGFSNVSDARARFAEAQPAFSTDLVNQFVDYGLGYDEKTQAWVWKRDPKLNSMAMLGSDTGDLRKLWSRIQCPVLHVHGSASPFADPTRDGQSKYFRDAQYLSIEGAGHWLQHEQPAMFSALLRDFLK